MQHHSPVERTDLLKNNYKQNVAVNRINKARTTFPN